MEKKSFQEYQLSEELERSINSLGYEEPTQVQKSVIPQALLNNDLIVRSQTGSGKTAAYGIPILERIDWLENKPQALILTPTRELAVQVRDELTNIGRFKRIKAIALYGRQPISIQKNELKQKNHVVVGTPGRVMDHIERGTLVLTQLRYLVIDEADEMLNMGFLSQVEAILKQLPNERVTMLFSATLPEEIKQLAQQFMNAPMEIETEDTGVTVDKITHIQYNTCEEEKFDLFKAVVTIENPDSCIVFCRTKDRVDILCSRLRDLGYPCNKIHGGMEQDDRLKTMKDLRKGAFRYLVTTDVAARGIDIEGISLVINYDVPMKKEGYVHRTGRTGRAGLEGKAITFVTEKEERYIREITEYIGVEILSATSPSEEEIEQKKPAFVKKLADAPILKSSKDEQLNKQIMKLHFNGGKKKKLRATNFVGVISNIPGVTAEDIGIITISDTLTYVDILNNKGPLVLKAMKTTPICGKQLKVSEARLR